MKLSTLRECHNKLASSRYMSLEGAAKALRLTKGDCRDAADFDTLVSAGEKFSPKEHKEHVLTAAQEEISRLFALELRQAFRWTRDELIKPDIPAPTVWVDRSEIPVALLVLRPAGLTSLLVFFSLLVFCRVLIYSYDERSKHH